MAQLFSNNASSQLLSGISNVATSLQLAANDGNKFPTITGGDFFLITVYKTSGGIESSWEIMKVTARSGDVLTVQRAVETINGSATAYSFAKDDVVHMRHTAGMATSIESHKNDTSNPHNTTKAQVGLGNVDNTSDATKAVLSATKLTTSRNIDGIAFDGSTDIAHLAPATFAATSKATPIDADTLPITDSAASNGLKKLTWANLKATLKTYLDTVHAALGTNNWNDTVQSQAMLKDCGVVAVDKGNSGTAAQTFDYTAGSKQKITATGAHSFAFSNWPPAGNEGYMRVDFVNYGAYTITPPTVTWTNPDGTETTSLPTHFTALAAVGGRSGWTTSGITKAIFWSSDAGTTVYGKFL